MCVSHTVMSDSLRPHGCSPSGSSDHGIFPGKNIGVGCHFLLQVIFPAQGLNPGLLHCRQIPYFLNHQGSIPLMLQKYSEGCFWYVIYTLIPKLRGKGNLALIGKFYWCQQTLLIIWKLKKICPLLGWFSWLNDGKNIIVTH